MRNVFWLTRLISLSLETCFAPQIVRGMSMTPQQRKAKLYEVLNETYKNRGLQTGEEIRENLNSWAAEKSVDHYLGEKLRELRDERRRARWDPYISPKAIAIGLAIGATLYFVTFITH
jgi:hypothetical protein